IAVLLTLPVLKKVNQVHSHWTLQSRPDYNLTTNYVVYREGLVTLGPHSTTIQKWACLERAWRFPDGVLLVTAGNIYLWLPVAEMVEGELERIDQTLREKVPRYKIIR